MDFKDSGKIFIKFYLGASFSSRCVIMVFAGKGKETHNPVTFRNILTYNFPGRFNTFRNETNLEIVGMSSYPKRPENFNKEM